MLRLGQERQMLGRHQATKRGISCGNSANLQPQAQLGQRAIALVALDNVGVSSLAIYLLRFAVMLIRVSARTHRRPPRWRANPGGHVINTGQFEHTLTASGTYRRRACIGRAAS